MGHNNGKITAPVNTDDVSTTIGVNSHDVATLCTHGNNNKWSRRKPLRGESPAEYTTWNRNTGNRGFLTGFPIYWGMRMPFNNSQQCTPLGHQRLLKPLAIRAAHLLSETLCANVKNYEYMRPVVGTDFCRLTDYDGYNHKAPEAWTCGVRGATPIEGSDSWTGSPGMLATIDAFDTAEVEFYMGMPSNADLSFKDLYDFGDFRFIVELYNYADRTNDSAVPAAILVCMTPLASMSSGAWFSITTKWLKQHFTAGSNSEYNIFAVAGVVRFLNNISLTELRRENTSGLGCAEVPSINNTYTVIAEGDGSIPPWRNDFKPFICQIKLRDFSKLNFYGVGYFRAGSAPTSDSQYTTFPDTATYIGADGFYLKCTIKNAGSQTVTINGAQSSVGIFPKFQIQATGAFDTTDPSYSSLCLSPAEGKWHDLGMLFYNPQCTTYVATNIVSNASANFYAKCFGIMPIGRTSGFTIRVSTDGGTTWVITGRFSGAFEVRSHA